MQSKKPKLAVHSITCRACNASKGNIWKELCPECEAVVQRYFPKSYFEDTKGVELKEEAQLATIFYEAVEELENEQSHLAIAA